ncbi:MAG: pyridoxamine 5'-phosphate oxidase family protein [Gemmatimonadales bacterium]
MTAPTPRVAVRRHSDRGRYDRETIDAILAEAVLAHVGFVVDGQLYVLPTLYARVGDTLYFHGAAANRMLGSITDGQPVCITVTLLDGLVMARAHYSHSANYRSVVVVGQGREVTDVAEKTRSFEALVEQVARGRWTDARQPNPTEIRVTRVVAVPLDEASAKVRTGPPVDDEADLASGHWAGVLPLRLAAGVPIAAPEMPAGAVPPDYLVNYRRPGSD